MSISKIVKAIYIFCETSVLSVYFATPYSTIIFETFKGFFIFHFKT